MDYGLDTSALMRILTLQPQPLAFKVVARVAEIVETGGILHVSDLAVFEAYYALQHSYAAEKGNAISYLLALSRQLGFRFSDNAVSALSKPNAATMSPGMVDCMIAGEYSAHGLRVLACEKDFRRFPNAEVVTE